MPEYNYLSALKAVLNGSTFCDFPLNEKETALRLYSFFKNHGICALGENIVKNSDINGEIKKLWLSDIRKSILNFEKILFLQDEAINILKSSGIPLAVIKGASLAINYNKPCLRETGDIDILVRPEDFLDADKLFIKSGYIKNHEDERHAAYRIPNSAVILEIHHRFALQNNRKYAEVFDGIIFSEFDKASEITVESYTFPVLNAVSDVLITLEHFLHHLETGIGLKQIADWNMLVKNKITCSAFEKEIYEKLEKCNLLNAAKILTSFSRDYLGLENGNFLGNADRKDVELFYRYIVSSRHFAYNNDGTDTEKLFILSARKKLGFKKRVELMTYYSVLHYPKLSGKKYLRFLAFVLQLFRYFFKLFKIKSLKDFFGSLNTVKEQKKLFGRLGLYENGK